MVAFLAKKLNYSWMAISFVLHVIKISKLLLTISCYNMGCEVVCNVRKFILNLIFLSCKQFSCVSL